MVHQPETLQDQASQESSAKGENMQTQSTAESDQGPHALRTLEELQALQEITPQEFTPAGQELLRLLTMYKNENKEGDIGTLIEILNQIEKVEEETYGKGYNEARQTRQELQENTSKENAMQTLTTPNTENTENQSKGNNMETLTELVGQVGKTVIKKDQKGYFIETEKGKGRSEEINVRMLDIVMKYIIHSDGSIMALESESGTRTDGYPYVITKAVEDQNHRQSLQSVYYNALSRAIYLHDDELKNSMTLEQFQAQSNNGNKIDEKYLSEEVHESEAARILKTVESNIRTSIRVGTLKGKSENHTGGGVYYVTTRRDLYEFELRAQESGIRDDHSSSPSVKPQLHKTPKVGPSSRMEDILDDVDLMKLLLNEVKIWKDNNKHGVDIYSLTLNPEDENYVKGSKVLSMLMKNTRYLEPLQ